MIWVTVSVDRLELDGIFKKVKVLGKGLPTLVDDNESKQCNHYEILEESRIFHQRIKSENCRKKWKCAGKGGIKYMKQSSNVAILQQAQATITNISHSDKSESIAQCFSKWRVQFYLLLTKKSTARNYHQ